MAKADEGSAAETINHVVSIDREFAVSHETTQDVVLAIEALFDEAKAAMVARVLNERVQG